MKLSIVLPARNESEGLRELLPKLKDLFPDAEVLVVNDGSNDDTQEVCSHNAVVCISHPKARGNGAAIKTGARNANGEIVVFMDADNQHSPEDIFKLLDGIGEGYDMVVGARVFSTHAGVHRGVANMIFNWFASWMVGARVKDLTSGFRAVRRDKFMKFAYILPNGFSYPTTITMSFFRAGYGVSYRPIMAMQRKGHSHINIWRDGVRFLLIIFKVGVLYSPLKIFFPVSAGLAIAGVGNYIYSYFSVGRFTNMSALLLLAALMVFLVGLVSEQITALMYRDSDS